MTEELAKPWRERVKGTEPPKHGLYGYSAHRCRCEICKQANTEYHRKRREFMNDPNVWSTHR